MNNKYEDIINLPHHTSSTHPRMSLLDRAAQFSPFAALTGHDAAIKETARLTNQRIELDENSKQLLDEKMQWIKNNKINHPEIQVTYFVPDEKKSGGAYSTIIGIVNKIQEYEHMICLDHDIRIPIEEIIDIDVVEENN